MSDPEIQPQAGNSGCPDVKNRDEDINIVVDPDLLVSRWFNISFLAQPCCYPTLVCSACQRQVVGSHKTDIFCESVGSLAFLGSRFCLTACEDEACGQSEMAAGEIWRPDRVFCPSAPAE